MVVFKFFPIWRMEETEQWLAEMEQQGLRLVEVRGFRFSFKQSKPKRMTYYLSCQFPRHPFMPGFNYFLESSHNANPIPSKMCYYTVYRTSEQKEQMQMLFDTRLDVIRSVLLEKIVLISIFLLIFLACFGLGIAFSKLTVLSIVLIVFVLLAMIIRLVYLCIGYIKQKLKCRAYDSPSGTSEE